MVSRVIGFHGGREGEEQQPRKITLRFFSMLGWKDVLREQPLGSRLWVEVKNVKRRGRRDPFRETTLFKSLYFSKGHAKPFKPRLSLEWSLKLVYRVFRDYRLVFARSSSLWKRGRKGEKGGIFVDFLKVCVVINKRMDLFLQKINIVFYCSFETRKDLHTRRRKNEYNKFSLIFIKK